MKIRLSIDKDAILGLGIEHGEKALFGAGVLCFLIFAYFAVFTETLEAKKQPDELVAQANKARDRMTPGGHGSTPWASTEDAAVVVVQDYPLRAHRKDL